MNKFLMCLVCCLFCSTIYANEWVPYKHLPPAPVVQLPAIQQYPATPVYVVVPLYIPYVPVVTYESAIVEHKQWCLFKKYEVINVPKVQYIPIKY